MPTHMDSTGSFPVILERLAMSYPRQSRFAFELMPLYETEVARESYKIIKIGSDHLKIEDFRRAYGSEAKRTANNIEGFVNVAIDRFTVESAVDRAEVVGAIDVVQASLLKREARLRNAYDKMMNSIENTQITSILDASKYGSHVQTVSGTDLWSHENSDPISQIQDARMKIKKATGLYPNKIVISDVVWQKLRYKKNLVECLPTTTLRSGITPEDFAKIIAVEKVVIADNMYQENNSLTFSWGANVVLAYIPKRIDTLETATFGITVRAPLGYAELRDYYDDRTTSDVTAVDERLGWTVANYNAGFLFKGVI